MSVFFPVICLFHKHTYFQTITLISLYKVLESVRPSRKFSVSLKDKEPVFVKIDKLSIKRGCDELKIRCLQPPPPKKKKTEET